MTVDLWMLVAAVGLNFALILLAATPVLLKDMKWGVGNREVVPERPGWSGRAHRASENLKENLPMFIALVLVAHVSGEADATSALGAQVFLGARVLHAIIYVAGVPVARTLIWAISVVGMAMIASSLF